MGDRPTRGEELARFGAGTAMAFAGISHLTFAREEFTAQVPDWVPIDADDTVLLSGAVEIALGLGLVALPKERRRMAGLLTAFLVAVFPGNISQYVHKRDGLGLDSDRKRLVRLLVEPLMWAAALHAGGLLRRKR
ncbi:membrane protein [Pseudonocardia ailaonensis]|uniref:Membrane protein n=1 Tax=Pseudonocardia ailaonensis TaxID=367279 RepID=A0ABN2MJT0_9PSEU